MRLAEIFLVISILFYLGCEPATGGNSAPIYENITTLTKTPLQIIDWTDSLWIHNADNTWECFEYKNSVKHNVTVFGKSNIVYPLLLIDNNKVYLLSRSGFLITADMNSKQVIEEEIENIIDPNENTIELSMQGGFPTIFSGGSVRVLTEGNWVKKTFTNLNLLSWERFNGYQVLANVEYFYVYSSFFGKVSHYHIKLVNESSSNDTLGIQSFVNFKRHKQDNFTILVMHNGNQTGITGLLSNDSYVPFLEAYSVSKPKLFSEKEYFIGPSKNLARLYITANGDITEERIVMYKDLPTTILDYWIYGKTVYLYLTDKKLVKVKI